MKNEATMIFEGITFGRVVLYTQLGKARDRIHAFYSFWISSGLSIAAYRAALIELRQWAQTKRATMPPGVDTDEIINAIDGELLYWHDDSGNMSR